MTGRSLKSAMRYAGSLNIPFVGIVGDNEAQKDAMTVKRLSDGLQKEIHLNQVVSHIKQLNQET
jgi:histidyl-tRNA synthetase